MFIKIITRKYVPTDMYTYHKPKEVRSILKYLIII